MYIEMDLTSLPPGLALREGDDFKGFRIVSRRPEHAFVGVEVLRGLAGERATDPDWSANLEKMIAYARSKGWNREDGAIRAHIEWTDS